MYLGTLKCLDLHGQTVRNLASCLTMLSQSSDAPCERVCVSEFRQVRYCLIFSTRWPIWLRIYLILGIICIGCWLKFSKHLQAFKLRQNLCWWYGNFEIPSLVVTHSNTALLLIYCCDLIVLPRKLDWSYLQGLLFLLQFLSIPFALLTQCNSIILI